jgi:hypothetical protein
VWCPEKPSGDVGAGLFEGGGLGPGVEVSPVEVEGARPALMSPL